MSDERVFLGLMTGTSLDAIDVVACTFSSERKISLLGSRSESWNESLRKLLFEFATADSVNMDDLALAHQEVARSYAGVITNFLASLKLSTREITAIGMHGQTVRHLPEQHQHSPFRGGTTFQLGSGAALAALTEIDVVWDFRSGDVALGGHGAPLVPVFDNVFLRSNDVDRLVVNIGGIANVTWLDHQSEDVVAYDSGPGNMILDALAQKYLGREFDEAGATSSRGAVDETLLETLLKIEYFHKLPPKSTGRELFGREVASQFYSRIDLGFTSIEDAMRTAAELTATTIVNCAHLEQSERAEIIVSGGGAKNSFLLSRIKTLAKKHIVFTSDECGIPSQEKESIAFAFLAKAFVDRELVHLPMTTGASRKILLGSYSSGKSN